MTNQEIFQIALQQSAYDCSCKYEIKVLYPEDFEQYYTDKWGNALCKSRKYPDLPEKEYKKTMLPSVTKKAGVTSGLSVFV